MHKIKTIKLIVGFTLEAKLYVLVCSITDTIWDSISSLAAADYLNVTRGLQQESSCSWTLYTDELNVFYLNDYLSATYVFLLTYTSVNSSVYSVRRKERK